VRLLGHRSHPPVAALRYEFAPAIAKRVDELEERSRRLEARRQLGVALRGRGLLLATEGRMQEALEAFGASLAELESIQAPFERARTLLALGTVQRRAKQKRAGRESLQAAIAMLEEIGKVRGFPRFPRALRARRVEP
jgi:tetratricopeptide (TPR) repeat protein